MRLAITGGTGFVGAHLLDAAFAAGHTVKALTRRNQAPREGLTWVSGDLQDRDALEKLVDGADAVIHVAGVITAPNAAGFELGNVAGTLSMLAAATSCAITRRLICCTPSCGQCWEAMFIKRDRSSRQIACASTLAMMRRLLTKKSHRLLPTSTKRSCAICLS